MKFHWLSGKRPKSAYGEKKSHEGLSEKTDSIDRYFSLIINVCVLEWWAGIQGFYAFYASTNTYYDIRALRNKQNSSVLVELSSISLRMSEWWLSKFIDNWWMSSVILTITIILYYTKVYLKRMFWNGFQNSSRMCSHGY